MNPQLVLIGLILGIVITTGLFWWLRRLKRQAERADLELPWSEHLDGTLARRLVLQIMTTIERHWPLVLNWALRHKWEKKAAKLILEPSLQLALAIGDERWVSWEDSNKVQVPKGQWSLILKVNMGDCRRVVFLTTGYCIDDSKPPEFVGELKVEILKWFAECIMCLHPHPRQLLTLLDNNVIERRLLRALGHPEALTHSAATSTDPLERGLSLVEGEAPAGEVIRRIRASDSPPPEQLSDTV